MTTPLPPAAMSNLVPCILDRTFPEPPAVWGGRALESVLGIPIPAGQRAGETWELYDRPDGSTRLRGSEQTVADLMRADPVGLLGQELAATSPSAFPISLKFLDAAKPLSVQVHPDDEQAAEENDCGKSEGWLVLHAGDNARVARGLRGGVTEGEFIKVANSAGVMDQLHVFAPEVGDAVHLPAGTVHTIGPDVLVFEIQSNSAVTYRMYDWDRERELQVDQALRAVRYDREPQTTVEPAPDGEGGEWVLCDERFRVRRVVPQRPYTVKTEGSFKVLTLLSGRAAIGWRSRGHEEPLLLESPDSMLVPACTSELFVSPVGAVIMLVSDAGGGG